MFMLLEILIGIGIGLLFGALIGLAEILSGSQQILEKDENKTKEATIFLPKDELKKYLQGKPRLEKLRRSLAQKNVTAAYMILEDGQVVGCEHVSEELKDEVSSKGYYYHRGDSQLTTRC